MSDYDKFKSEFNWWRKAHHLVSRAACDEVVAGRSGIEEVRLANQLWAVVEAHKSVMEAYCFDVESFPVSAGSLERWLADELTCKRLDSLYCLLDVLRGGVVGALTCEQFEAELA